MPSLSFILSKKNFLSNKKIENYTQLVQNILLHFNSLGCIINMKVNYLHSNLNHFTENPHSFSKIKSKRFHLDITKKNWMIHGRLLLYGITLADPNLRDFCVLIDWNLYLGYFIKKINKFSGSTDSFNFQHFLLAEKYFNIVFQINNKIFL